MDLLEVLRQYRIGPFAAFDTVLAYGGMFLVAPFLTKIFFKIHINISSIGWLWLTLPISVLFHLIFRQNTPFMKMLFNPHEFQFYVSISILIFMTYMAFWKNLKL